jgi:predicted nucleic acid-binding protein
VIYVDTSVALAHLLSENRAPPAAFWDQVLVTSRLSQYEIWTRLRAYHAEARAGAAAAELIDRMTLFELAPEVLSRALEPFPVPVRTLDALHLATISYIADQGRPVEVATYDQRMLQAAQALGFRIVQCG